MPTLSPQARAIVAAFGQQPGVNPDHLNNLQSAISASPALTDQMNDAVANGHLKAIVPLTNPNAGGEYDPGSQAMRLPLSRLTTPPQGPFQARTAQENAGEITFVLGHELQHGLNRVATKQAYIDFANDVRQIAKNDLSPRDYTAPAAALLAQNRRDEAGAEIAGWNAIVSRVKSANPNSTPSLQDIYEAQPGRIRDFVDKVGNTYTLKPGLQSNQDLTLSATPANIEAMGRHYFDKAATTSNLGALGNSDYVNYYGRSPVSFIAQTERHYHPPQQGVTAPQMGLDLTRLRLNEKLLEENGIDLGQHQQPLPYYDLANQPPTAHLFQHTKTTHQHVSPIAAEVLEAEMQRGQAQPSPASRRSDTDQSLLEKLQGEVRRLDQAAGKPWDDASERLSASALLMAKQAGFSANDELRLAFNQPTQRHAGGAILHLFRDGLSASPDPAANRASMTTAKALSTPAQERYQEVDALAQTQAQAQQHAQQQVLSPDDPTRSGPVMRM
jgi:hypothetical protein